MSSHDTKRVVDEWHYLQDKCAVAFAGLREASPFGRAFVGVFQKTFECYTRYDRRKRDAQNKGSFLTFLVS